LEAESVDAAGQQLMLRGFIPTRIYEAMQVSTGVSFARLGARIGTVRAQELILFTKQLRTMIRAGIPMLTLLEVLERQADNPRLRSIVSVMIRDIREGASLTDAFRKHPRVFSNLYCSMVQAGEASGALPVVLDRLIYIIEHENKVRSDIKSALQYPIIVILFLGIAFFILLTFVIPKFVSIFTTSGLKLPLPTRICINLYHAISNFWPVLIIGFALGIVSLGLFMRTEAGRFLRDRLVLALPLVGPMFVKGAMARFAAIFAILQSSGVAVLDSMRILVGTIGNRAIGRELEKIREHLQEGRGIAAPLKTARFFTPMVTGMVAVGEESGNLDEMLREVASHYDAELEYAVKKLSDAIGPILVIGLAAVVGFFALAIFLPMWDLTRMVR